MLKSKTSLFVLWIVIALLFSSCGSNPVPKPRGYVRIDLPEKSYTSFDTNFPYSFEYPVYGRIEPHVSAVREPFWINLAFPQFRGQVHISYKKIEGNLYEYLEDSRTFVMKQIPKADAITDSLVEFPEKDLYGLVYSIKGIGAASPVQFILTDSSDHFVRGALYFNFVPNNDSLQPVIDFLSEDIRHMIETFEWR
jgi:gliding motility-associated lipoprotein GldD